MVHLGICHHSDNVDKWFLKYVLPFTFYIYFWNCMKPHWYLNFNWKSPKDFFFFFFSIWNNFPLCSYLFFTSLHAEITLRKYSTPFCWFCWEKHLERMLFKFSCFLCEDDGEEKILFYRILENHLTFAQNFHGDCRK